MTANDIRNKLNQAFGDFKFFEEDHHYELNGKLVGISVTKFIEQYANEFNLEEQATRTAKKEGRSKQDVINDWKYKNEFACRKGSTCHEYIQSLFTNEHWFYDNFDFSAKYNDAVCKIKIQADNFFNQYKDKWEHIEAEQVVGSEEYDIASAVDGLFLDKQSGEFILADYKTNTFITGLNKEPFKKPMLPPLQHLNDDKFNHYKLQLSIYRYLIERYTDLKIDKMVIIYITETNDDYQLIEIPYLKNEVEDILEWRKWE